jgi:hypothetical protein
MPANPKSNVFLRVGDWVGAVGAKVGSCVGAGVGAKVGAGVGAGVVVLLSDCAVMVMSEAAARNKRGST